MKSTNFFSLLSSALRQILRLRWKNLFASNTLANLTSLVPPKSSAAGKPQRYVASGTVPANFVPFTPLSFEGLSNTNFKIKLAASTAAHATKTTPVPIDLSTAAVATSEVLPESAEAVTRLPHESIEPIVEPVPTSVPTLSRALSPRQTRRPNGVSTSHMSSKVRTGAVAAAGILAVANLGMMPSSSRTLTTVPTALPIATTPAPVVTVITMASPVEKPINVKPVAPILEAWSPPTISNYGRVSSRYGMRRHPNSGEIKRHTGIDLARGNFINAAENGCVISARWRKGYGYTIEIAHNNYEKYKNDNGQWRCEVMGNSAEPTLSTLYAHIKKGGMYVSADEYVDRNQHIADVGATGGSVTGPHLHYEVRIGNKPKEVTEDDLKNPLWARFGVSEWVAPVRPDNAKLQYAAYNAGT